MSTSFPPITLQVAPLSNNAFHDSLKIAISVYGLLSPFVFTIKEATSLKWLMLLSKGIFLVVGESTSFTVDTPSDRFPGSVD